VQEVLGRAYKVLDRVQDVLGAVPEVLRPVQEVVGLMSEGTPDTELNPTLFTSTKPPPPHSYRSFRNTDAQE